VLVRHAMAVVLRWLSLSLILCPGDRACAEWDAAGWNTIIVLLGGRSSAHCWVLRRHLLVVSWWWLLLAWIV
jgi:hypothetical protein